MGKIGDLWVRLGLKSDDYKKGMKDAQKETTSFSDKLGKMKTAALAVWAAVGAAVLAFAKQMKDATNRVGDAWDMFIAKSTAGWQTFVQSLSAWNWDNFIGRIREAVAAAGALQAAMDASFEINNSIKLQKAAMAEELASLEILARNVSKPYEERARAAQKYLDMVKPLYDQELELANRLLDAQQGRWLAGTGLQDNAQTRKDLEKFLVDYGKDFELSQKLSRFLELDRDRTQWGRIMTNSRANEEAQQIARDKSLEYGDLQRWLTTYGQEKGYGTSVADLARVYENMRGDADTKPLVDAIIAAGQAKAAYDAETKRMQQALNNAMAQGGNGMQVKDTGFADSLAADLERGLQDVYAAVDAIDFSDIEIKMPDIDMSAFDRAEERLDQFVDEWAKEQEEIARLNEMLSNTIANSIAGGVEAFTDMLFNLEDADATSILSALMQPFAQTAAQLGTMLIAQGVAVEAFNKSLSTLQGAPAIAAGAALLAVSAAMKSGIKALAGGKAGASTATTYSGNDSANGISYENYDSTITVEVVGKISGSDILLAGSNQQKKWNR
jgi:hypothetical protein